MRKALLIVFIVLVIIISISSCTQSEPAASQEGENASNQESQIVLENSEVLLKFDVSDIVKTPSHRSARAGDIDLSKYYVIYQNVASDDPEIRHFSLDSTEVELKLEKGGIYVVAVAQDTEEGIEVIGFLGEPHYGITCIPVSSEAESLIDLGRVSTELVNGEVVIKPDVSAEEFAKMMGFEEETLERIGKADVTFKNLLNPDINRNGVFDDEENLRWHITSMYDFNYTQDGVSLEEFRYVFWMNVEYPEQAYGEGFKHCPNEGNLDDCWDILPEYATLTLLNTGEIIQPSYIHIEFGHDYQWYFPGEPVNGDYRLDAAGEESGRTYSFYFYNLRFFNPVNDYDGIVYPKFRVEVFSDGKVKNISWKWYQKAESGSELANEEIIRLLSDKNIMMYLYFSSYEQFINGEVGPNTFYLFKPQDLGINPYIDNSYDVSNFPGGGFWVQPRTGDVVEGRGDYRMIGETDVAFHFKYDYLPTPSTFEEEDDEPLTFDSTSEVMEILSSSDYWYNLYVNSINYLSRESVDVHSTPAFIIFRGENGKYTLETQPYFDEYEPRSFYFDVTAYKFSPDGKGIALELTNEFGEKQYIYLEIHDSYFESMLYTSGEYTKIDDVPMRIDRDSSNYVIYSKRPEIETDESNNPPNAPSNPNPPDGATNVSLGVTLSWECSDPDGDKLEYEIYGGFAEDGLTYVTRTSSSSYTPPSEYMWPSTTYYWKIIAVDEKGAKTEGPVWKFTTTNPPSTPSNPEPVDGATNASLDVTLNWYSFDPDGDAISYEVYLGTDPESFEHHWVDINAPFNLPIQLQPSTTYYWKVIAIDDKMARTEGPVWEFMTTGE